MFTSHFHIAVQMVESLTIQASSHDRCKFCGTPSHRTRMDILVVASHVRCAMSIWCPFHIHIPSAESECFSRSHGATTFPVISFRYSKQYFRNIPTPLGSRWVPANSHRNMLYVEICALQSSRLVLTVERSRIAGRAKTNRMLPWHGLARAGWFSASKNNIFSPDNTRSVNSAAEYVRSMSFTRCPPISNE